jgi:hypothetical protein
MTGACACVRAALLAVLLCPSAASSQGAALAGVRGTVTRADGAALERAIIEIRHAPTGRTVSVETDAAGRYVIANLPAGGAHTLTVAAFGYASRRIESVQLQAGTIHRYDFRLEPGALTLPEVEVRARADARFDAGRSGAATVVGEAEVRSHPTIERSVMELVALSPMAARVGGGTSIAGQNSRYNALQIDGARYQDLFGTAADGAPGGIANARPLPLDAVEQFQVLVAPFDVRQSGFTGGMVNVVTRGGTNEWQAGGFGHYRDRHFLGTLETDAQSSGVPSFRNALAGISVGGPVVRDRGHVFVALEMERRTTGSSGYNLGSADPFAARVAPDSAARFAQILRDRYGVDAGTAAQVTLDNPRENVFARTDWQLGRHRLMLRHNYAAAQRDVQPNRAATGAYEFGSRLYAYRSSTHATTLQLVSVLGSRWSNELLVNAHRITDGTRTASTAPTIDVDVVSDFDSVRVRRLLRAGGRHDVQPARVTQTGIELRNAVTAALGSHLLTVGAVAEALRVSSRFTSNPHGHYTFRDLAALEAGRPVHYERTLDLADPTVRFDAGHLGAFIQDEWRIARGLTLHLGVRVDVPVLRDPPEENTALRAALGVSTATLPRTAPLWSPRAAFNWQSGARTTQLRGGIGLFTGRPAYSWLAGAYAQTGLRSALLTCDSVSAPPIGTLTSACSGTSGAPLRPPPITLFARDFRFPQDLRIAAGIDQALPRGFVASADVVLGVSRRQLFLRDLNLGAPVTPGSDDQGWTDGFGFHRRDSFGMPVREGFATVRPAPGFHQVIELGDDAHNRALALSLEVAGSVAKVNVRGAYTFTRSIDAQSLTHPDAAVSFAAVPGAGHPNAPVATRSDFDRPHRLLLSLSRHLTRSGDSEISLLYIGESGAPFTYVYGFDINGDGAPAPGLTEAFNDPLWVPQLISQFPGTLGSAAAFFGLLDADPCLAAMAGTVVARNSCRAPAIHRLDLRATHALRVGRTEVRLVADLLNLLHLLGSDRGLVYTVPSLVPILDVSSPRTHSPGPPPPEHQPLVAWFAGPRVRDADGSFRSLLPYSVDPARSRWQAQLGIEIRRNTRR